MLDSSGDSFERRMERGMAEVFGVEQDGSPQLQLDDRKKPRCLGCPVQKLWQRVPLEEAIERSGAQLIEEVTDVDEDSGRGNGGRETLPQLSATSQRRSCSFDRDQRRMEPAGMLATRLRHSASFSSRATACACS